MSMGARIKIAVVGIGFVVVGLAFSQVPLLSLCVLAGIIALILTLFAKANAGERMTEAALAAEREWHGGWTL